MTLPVAVGPKATAHDIGVPSGQIVHVHPWPTRFHGGIWKRPAFAFPYVRSPQSVFKPDDFARTGPPTRVRRIRGVPNSAYARYPWPLNGLAGQALGMQYDTHRGVFGSPGQGSGIFGASAAHGLGAETNTIYPWREYSDATKTLQATTSALLKDAGYCPISVDGKLGPGTCAAMKLLWTTKGQGLVDPASVCQSYGTAPAKAPNCGGGGGTLPVTMTTPPSPSEAAAAATFAPSRFPTKAIAFAVGGIAALGFVALIAHKKGLF